MQYTIHFMQQGLFHITNKIYERFMKAFPGALQKILYCSINKGVKRGEDCVYESTICMNNV